MGAVQAVAGQALSRQRALLARPKKRWIPERQSALPLGDPTTRLLPMQLHVGDVVLDRTGNDWEIVSRPVGIQKKQVVARVQGPGRPEAEKEQRWDVYERVTVRSRGTS